MLSLLDRTLRCERDLKPKDIAMISWAFGRFCPLDWNMFGPPIDMLCTVLSSSALLQIRRFTAQDLAELAVGVVSMQYDNANLMQVRGVMVMMMVMIMVMKMMLMRRRMTSRRQ
jgi:hypothetical protein